MIRRPQKIISGGQTGADQGGIWGAAECGIPTGGVMPKGFRTEDGPNPEFARIFGLTEHSSSEYPPRTSVNVQTSDGTVVFGRTHERGSQLTIRLCEQYGRPYILNPDAERLRAFIIRESIKTLNIAGNRESKNPGIGKHVQQTIMEAFTEPQHDA